jgi:hypothetical protein
VGATSTCRFADVNVKERVNVDVAHPTPRLVVNHQTSRSPPCLRETLSQVSNASLPVRFGSSGKSSSAWLVWNGSVGSGAVSITQVEIGQP